MSLKEKALEAAELCKARAIGTGDCVFMALHDLFKELANKEK